MNITRIIQIITGIAGLLALVVGLAIWFAEANTVIPVHMILGLIVTLGLLILSTMAVFRSELRVLGIIGIIYAVFVPVFGMAQFNLLEGDLHWLIQVAHTLVGLGAMALAGNIGARYARLRQAAA